MDKETAIAIQRAEVEKVILYPSDGQLFFILTSHFFFNDFDETPVAVVKSGKPSSLLFLPDEAGQAAKRKREAKFARLRGNASAEASTQSPS